MAKHARLNQRDCYTNGKRPATDSPEVARQQRQRGLRPSTLEADTVARIEQDFTLYEPLEIFDRLLWTCPLRLSQIKDCTVALPDSSMEPREQLAVNRTLEEQYGVRDVGA